MMLTEKEAHELWCPFTRQETGIGTFNRMRDGSIPPSCACIASGCMAWRWSLPGALERAEGGDRLGYCGLAGRPIVEWRDHP